MTARRRRNIRRISRSRRRRESVRRSPTSTPPDSEGAEALPAAGLRSVRPPPSDANCLEELIDEQAAAIAEAEKAKTFKAELEELLDKAKDASQEYTRDKYDELVKQWVEQDKQIAELIRKLVCAVPCWRCVIECYVCPLLNEIVRRSGGSTATARADTVAQPLRPPVLAHAQQGQRRSGGSTGSRP